jgi:hypothetical protein
MLITLDCCVLSKQHNSAPQYQAILQQHCSAASGARLNCGRCNSGYTPQPEPQKHRISTHPCATTRHSKECYLSIHGRAKAKHSHYVPISSAARLKPRIAHKAHDTRTNRMQQHMNNCSGQLSVLVPVIQPPEHPPPLTPDKRMSTKPSLTKETHGNLYIKQLPLHWYGVALAIAAGVDASRGLQKVPLAAHSKHAVLL